MAKPPPSPRKRLTKSRSLMVRLDDESKDLLARAAQLRRVSVSDYVREVTLAQARREVQAARDKVIVLTSEEQLAFWSALHEPVHLTEAQRKLGAIMRALP